MVHSAFHGLESTPRRRTMVSLKRGDRVKTIIEIKNNWQKPNVKRGAKGTVISTKPGNKVEVHFPSDGFLWPEVTCDVETKYLDKIW